MKCANCGNEDKRTCLKLYNNYKNRVCMIIYLHNVNHLLDPKIESVYIYGPNKKYIKKRVHELYYGIDMNCARTTMTCISELMNIKIEDET